MKRPCASIVVVIQAWATPGRNGERDFHGERRSNATHASTSDPEARLFRKGRGKEVYAGGGFPALPRRPGRSRRRRPRRRCPPWSARPCSSGWNRSSSTVWPSATCATSAGISATMDSSAHTASGQPPTGLSRLEHRRLVAGKRRGPRKGHVGTQVPRRRGNRVVVLHNFNRQPQQVMADRTVASEMPVRRRGRQVRTEQGPRLVPDHAA